MTEDDEALLWVRENAAAYCDRHGDWLQANAFRQGHNDDLLTEEAQAYRAGQAASAERVKALEGLLRECADALEAEVLGRSANDLPRRIERDMEPVKKARALIKEADHD
jgi:hypothetical protein